MEPVFVTVTKKKKTYFYPLNFFFAGPRIISKLKAKSTGFLKREYELTKQFTSSLVKITIPGPLTIYDNSSCHYYKSKEELMNDLATIINKEILMLVSAGCKHIQIDEPVFMRHPRDALQFGIKALERCFADIGENVFKSVHMCCGYPNHLDDADYAKADPQVLGIPVFFVNS